MSDAPHPRPRMHSGQTWHPKNDKKFHCEIRIIGGDVEYAEILPRNKRGEWKSMPRDEFERDWMEEEKGQIRIVADCRVGTITFGNNVFWTMKEGETFIFDRILERNESYIVVSGGLNKHIFEKQSVLVTNVGWE